MPEQIISSSGTQFGLIVNPDGSINVNTTVSIDSIYIQSGNNVHLGSAWTNIGSVLVSNIPLPVIGSIAITNTGSVVVTNVVSIGSGLTAVPILSMSDGRGNQTTII